MVGWIEAEHRRLVARRRRALENELEAAIAELEAFEAVLK